MIGEGLGAISEIFILLRQWILVTRRKNSELSKWKKKTTDSALYQVSTYKEWAQLLRVVYIYCLTEQTHGAGKYIMGKSLMMWGKFLREEMFLFLKNSINIRTELTNIFLVFALKIIQTTY